MSHIHLRKTDQNSEPYGWSVPVPDDVSPDVSRDSDTDMARFIAALINEIVDLGEGEALAIWKEIY